MKLITAVKGFVMQPLAINPLPAVLIGLACAFGLELTQPGRILKNKILGQFFKSLSLYKTEHKIN
jgi:hypothetical protein